MSSHIYIYCFFALFLISQNVQICITWTKTICRNIKKTHNFFIIWLKIYFLTQSIFFSLASKLQKFLYTMSSPKYFHELAFLSDEMIKCDSKTPFSYMKPMSKALYNAIRSLWADTRQNGKFNWKIKQNWIKVIEKWTEKTIIA